MGITGFWGGYTRRGGYTGSGYTRDRFGMGLPGAGILAAADTLGGGYTRGYDLVYLSPGIPTLHPSLVLTSSDGRRSEWYASYWNVFFCSTITSLCP